MLETSRLILRQWEAKDRAPFAALNADSDVMRFFPAPLEKAESDNLADRFSEGIAERGWGFWAVELKKHTSLWAVWGYIHNLINFIFHPAPK